MLRLLGILTLGNMIFGGHRCHRHHWHRHGGFLGRGLLIVYEPCESESHRGGLTVFEYRVEIYAVRSAETEMNRMAADGWRVIAVSPNIAVSHGIVVTFERKK